MNNNRANIYCARLSFMCFNSNLIFMNYTMR